MNYFIKRGDQQYGPYTLAALQQYVAQGNISPQDLARSEAMTDWVPVSSILGNVLVTAPVTFASSVNLPSDLPLPPNLHWAVVLALGIVTLGIFWVIWLFVQASWVRKIRPESRALYYLLGYIGAIVVGVLIGGPGGALIRIAGFGLSLAGVFSMRSDIEEHYSRLNPAGLHLSGVMTFFFNAIYFQYHFQEIRELSQRASASSATAGQLA
jgi:hypothetical protein